MLLLLLPWLLLEQRPADLSLQQGDRAVKVEMCSRKVGDRSLHGLNQKHRAPMARMLSPRPGNEAGLLRCKYPLQIWS